MEMLNLLNSKFSHLNVGNKIVDLNDNNRIVYKIPI